MKCCIRWCCPITSSVQCCHQNSCPLHGPYFPIGVSVTTHEIKLWSNFPMTITQQIRLFRSSSKLYIPQSVEIGFNHKFWEINFQKLHHDMKLIRFCTSLPHFSSNQFYNYNHSVEKYYKMRSHKKDSWNQLSSNGIPILQRGNL